MIREGKIAVPNRPGLGIEPDLDVAYKYRKPGEKFFELPYSYLKATMGSTRSARRAGI